MFLSATGHVIEMPSDKISRGTIHIGHLMRDWEPIPEFMESKLQNEMMSEQIENDIGF